MRLLIPAVLIAAGTIMSISSNAQEVTGLDHAQHRAEDFVPGSGANQAEQNRLSAYDAQQQKLDDLLDNKLNSCRC